MDLFAGRAGRPLVKICGLRREQDLLAATEAGADLIGLVFAPSRRRVGKDEAASLLRGVACPPAVGVFVDSPADEILDIADAVGLAAVQLSGHERPEEVARLTLPVIKTVHLRPGQDLAATMHIISRYPHATALLLDGWSPQGGGSGRVADWALAAAIIRAADRPVLLAGGLRPDNVAAALAQTGAAGADVSSGVERDGWKDAGLMRAFVLAARHAGGSQADAPGP